MCDVCQVTEWRGYRIIARILDNVVIDEVTRRITGVGGSRFYVLTHAEARKVRLEPMDQLCTGNDVFSQIKSFVNDSLHPIGRGDGPGHHSGSDHESDESIVEVEGAIPDLSDHSDGQHSDHDPEMDRELTDAAAREVEITRALEGLQRWQALLRVRNILHVGISD